VAGRAPRARGIVIGRAFYCASSALYFPGAAAMINSLRLQGHDDPVFVLDCGLDAAQRGLLDGHAKLVPMPAEVPPYLLKTVAPIANPARTMVLIDADMIVTRSLGPLLDAAAAGGVVAFENDMDRFVPEWGAELDLGVAERRPYVSSGFVALCGERGAEVLRLWDDRQQRVDFSRSCFADPDPAYPLLYLDQDVLNAVIATRVAADELHAVEGRLSANPPFDGLRVTDAERLRCAFRDGAEPYLLHHFDRKPWVARLRSNVYSRLLTRLLLGADVPIRLSPSQLPPRLRTGAAADAARLGTDVLMAGPGAVRRVRERFAAAPDDPIPSA